MKKVLLFGDPGIDDAIAIMYALLHPEIELVGVVASYGNVNEKQATDNAAYLLQLAGRQDIPVIRGAKGPFSGELVTYYPEIHGPEGLGPIRPPEGFSYQAQDFGAVFDIIAKYKDELTIVDVGRSTSLATAYILAGADQINRSSAVYLMGGSFLHPGNVTAEAEANFHGDPIATDLVLEKGRNITIIPLNVTGDAVVSQQVIDWIANQKTNPFTSLMKPIMDFYIEAYKELSPGLEGAPIHDALALFALLNPDAFGYLSRRVRVDTSNLSRGKAIADFRTKPEEEPPETLDRIALTFNYDVFLEDFVKIMTRRL
ncbi:nucleoside hydrolase [Mesobacillus maritimus]|uniref:nucleoside hydrolase n=1 Tax=Mesobacillus maritimus TaxID=1643336 RepID=UPI00203BDFA6|nr:nucleoside hydrolase [Mesobacillus maritimus]MCM3670647.1 nucleoside hydrolase [Mesobacillus maritimus]